MAWVSVQEQLKDHPKLRDLAKRLGSSRHEAAGVLLFLWIWGINNADREGNLLCADECDIATAVMSAGLSAGRSNGQSNGQSAFFVVDCLAESGWIDIVDGGYRLHDWDVWQKEWFAAIDKRNADTARKRAERKEKKTTLSEDCPTDCPVESRRDVRPLPSPSPSPSPNHIPEPEPEENTTREIAEEEPRDRCDYSGIMRTFNEVCRSLPSIRYMTDDRKRRMKAWGISVDEFRIFCQQVEASDFLTGKASTDRQWTADFDWITAPKNRQKIIEGKYTNKGRRQPPQEDMFDRMRRMAEEGTL